MRRASRRRCLPALRPLRVEGELPARHLEVVPLAGRPPEIGINRDAQWNQADLAPIDRELIALIERRN